jgi:hypothetical protein
MYSFINLVKVVNTSQKQSTRQSTQGNPEGLEDEKDD